MNNRKGQFDNLQFCKDRHILTGAMQELGTWFQSTHPNGRLFALRFNPRTRMGCDADADRDEQRDSQVSIHAPAWGATVCILCVAPLQEFQSTHPHGVRLMQRMLCDRHRRFQSTHPHGVRRIRALTTSRTNAFQSTHPHGVRRPTRQADRQRHLFQSTHPHGVRPYHKLAVITRAMFQSTHPHGVRPLMK